MLTHFEDIASTLAEQGVRFDHWQATAKIRPGASHEDVISACQAPIDTLVTQHGLRAIDVISLDRDHPQKESIRASFFAEHRQDETEVMLFSAGSALLSVYIDDYVYAVLCEKGDLIVAAGRDPAVAGHRRTALCGGDSSVQQATLGGQFHRRRQRGTFSANG